MNQPEQIAVKEELKTLSDKLDRLSEKLEIRGKRDVWDKFQIISGVVSSIILATLGFYFTYHFNENEAKKEAAQQQLQQRTTELQAIISLNPQLSSTDKNVQHHAELTLQALTKSKPLKDSPEAESSNLLNQYVDLVQSNHAPDSVRSNAVKDIADIAKNGADPAIREKAKQVVTNFAASTALPVATRNVANAELKSLRSVQPNAIASLVDTQTCTRPINEIIIHDATPLRISQYKGVHTIYGIKEFNLSQGHEDADWHYNIAPDGLVWLGRPLQMVPASIHGHNFNTISIMLLLSGDEELPTIEQRKSLALLINELSKRFHINPLDNFSDDKGFHRDYDARKSCPGRMITKSEILQWLDAYKNG